MTIVEPIPDLQYGKGAWQDYISNWRTRDTNWMQERLILRYASPTTRGNDWPAPKSGQVTYNDTTGLLEMWSQTKGAWLRSLMFQYLLSNKDDATGVSLFHASSGAKGVQLTPTSLLVDAPTTNFLNGVSVIDATGFALKVGAKTAKLSTDATALVSDSPIRAPSIASDGALTAVGALSAGSLSAPSATFTSTLTLTGATVNGGTLNGASAAINGVQIGNASAFGAGGVRADAQGFTSGLGSFRGDSGGAIMQQRAAGGGYGSAYLQVTPDRTNVAGDMYINTGYLRIMGGRGIPWHNAGGGHQAWISPCIYSGGDPGAGNFPDGTIWIS
jgi:hypothetical protein